MLAYTYTIRQLSTGKIYYGVRKSSTLDLGLTYFSSSKLLKRLISETGIEDFEFKIRRKFESYELARVHETKILIRINAISNPNVLNQAISSPRICSKDSKSEEERKQKISNSMKKLWDSPEYRNKQTFHKLSKEERSKRGKAGAKKTNELRKCSKKVKRQTIYKNINIIRDNVIKTIKANQVPAYKKFGWERLLETLS